MAKYYRKARKVARLQKMLLEEVAFFLRRIFGVQIIPVHKIKKNLALRAPHFCSEILS